MRKQEIEITIGPTGEVSFQVKGVKGARCVDETRFLEDAVGEVREQERTSEYYEESEKDAATRHVGGDED
jgi:hypothetical protein